MRRIALFVASLASAISFGDVYDNASVTNSVNGAGQPISMLVPPAATFGFGGQIQASNRIAEDFTVTGHGWVTRRISFFPYQTGASEFTFSVANVDIVRGIDPNSGASVLSLRNQGVRNGGLVGFRVSNLNIDLTNRRMYRVDVPISTVLEPGRYCLIWSVGGTLASGPWFAPSAPYVEGNAWQSLNGGQFMPVFDTGLGLRAEIPFQIEFTPVPEPGAIAATTLGVLGWFARKTGKSIRRRKTTSNTRKES